MTFDPTKPLESYQTALTDYLASLIASGDEVDYEIQFSFPEPEDLRKLPMSKTIIHFDVDDYDSEMFGFGDNVIASAYDSGSGTVVDSEVVKYQFNLDVGVWSSVNGGGSSARLRAHQLLFTAFEGASAYKLCLANAGIEIVSFSGGRYVRDTENDVPLYRIVGMTLVIAFYGRKDHTFSAIEAINQDNTLMSLELDDHTTVIP